MFPRRRRVPRLDVLLVDDEDYYQRSLHPILSAITKKITNFMLAWSFEPPRLALPLLSAYLQKAGMSVACVYHYSNGIFKKWTFTRLLRKKPLIVGISTTAIGRTRTLENIVARVRRESPRSRIVLGGFGAQYRTAMRRLGDVVVSDFGELALVKLVESLKRDPNLDSVAGITKGPDQVRVLPGRTGFYPDETMLHPDLSVIDAYFRSIPIEASRGCRYNCSYCVVPGKRRHVFRKPADVIEEIKEQVRKYKKNHLYFVDPNLTSDSDFILELMGLLKKAEPEVRWYCMGRVDDFARQPALAAAMVAAGCYKVMLGIESIHDHILARMRKGYTRSVVEAGLQSIAAAHLPVCASFMIGFPGETVQTTEATVDFILKAGFNIISLAPLMVSKELFEEARAKPEFHHHLRGDSPRHWIHDTMDYNQAEDLTQKMVARINRNSLFPVALALRFWDRERDKDIAASFPTNPE